VYFFSENDCHGSQHFDLDFDISENDCQLALVNLQSSVVIVLVKLQSSLAIVLVTCNLSHFSCIC
jgi:hypothetical protein